MRSREKLYPFDIVRKSSSPAIPPAQDLRSGCDSDNSMPHRSVNVSPHRLSNHSIPFNSFRPSAPVPSPPKAGIEPLGATSVQGDPFFAITEPIKRLRLLQECGNITRLRDPRRVKPFGYCANTARGNNVRLTRPGPAGGISPRRPETRGPGFAQPGRAPRRARAPCSVHRAAS